MMNEVHIPTVGSQANVINIPTPLEAIFSSLLGKLTQTLLNDPVLTVEYNTLGFTPVFERVDIGRYVSIVAVPNPSKTFVFMGSSNKDGVEATVVSGGINEVSGKIAVGSFNAPVVAEDEYKWVDDEMTDCPIEIKVVKFAVPTSLEELFVYMTKQIDATQSKIWRKMVLRFNGTITEVDGDLWRKTGVFSDSSQTINS